MKSTKVWDIPTRLCHWLLAGAVIYAWLSVEILENMQHHFWAAYTALTLVLFRIVWGFVGSHHARFYTWLGLLPKLLAYVRGRQSFLGHNPLGVLSAVALLFSILFQCLSGLFNSDDYFHGPLSGKVSSDTLATLNSLHDLNGRILTALIVLHLVAIAFYQLVKKQNLVKAMLTGNKPIASQLAEQASKNGLHSTPKVVNKWWRALLILLLCAATVYLIAVVWSDPIVSSAYDFSY